VRRVGDVVLGVPVIVGLILLLSVLVSGQRTALHIVLAFTALLWPVIARITRQATMAIKPQPYIEAARAVGASDLSICVRHVLPNALPAVVAYATTMAGLLIGTEAVLSFLGVGLQSPSVSWGLMIDAGQVHYATDPYLLLFPGAFLAASVAGFILIGDALAERGSSSDVP
jgi:oligopeptide transport system permease protein